MLTEAGIQLDSTIVYSKLYKKTKSGEKKERLTKQELEDCQIAVTTAIGGPNGEFNTCLITIVKQLVTELSTMSDVAFTYAVVCVSLCYVCFFSYCL